MDSFQYNDRSGIGGLIDMVARGCERLMREGGTAVTRENRSPDTWNRTTPEQREAALAMAREGKLTVTQIARTTGMTQANVFKMVKRLGLQLPDGRKLRYNPLGQAREVAA